VYRPLGLGEGVFGGGIAWWMITWCGGAGEDECERK